MDGTESDQRRQAVYKRERIFTCNRHDETGAARGTSGDDWGDQCWPPLGSQDQIRSECRSIDQMSSLRLPLRADER